IGRFNSKDSSGIGNYHSYSLGNESMTAYQRAKSGRRVLITALYFFLLLFFTLLPPPLFTLNPYI
ncbi:hypothetical protein, partial [Bacteroides sp. HMSC068A09]|uniref:hypothetical protein n=1 Tax=Bacteroides sp. HMSC068A09 TaxID=1739319 RepID=UPI001AEF575E